MVDRESARNYLRRRISDYEVGAGNMSPDEAAIATLLLDLDVRVDAILEKLERGAFWWVSPLSEAIIKNKALLAALIGIAATAAISILSKLAGR